MEKYAFLCVLIFKIAHDSERRYFLITTSFPLLFNWPNEVNEGCLKGFYRFLSIIGSLFMAQLLSFADHDLSRLEKDKYQNKQKMPAFIRLELNAFNLKPKRNEDNIDVRMNFVSKYIYADLTQNRLDE